MQQEPFNLEAAIIFATIVFLVLGSFIVMIMLVYRKRRNAHIIEKINIKSEFQRELLKTQIEIQEQTLNQISREIHDNITQVLSFVKINLGMINPIDEAVKVKITESRELVSQTINDLRNLSKSMSFEHISAIGLIKTIEKETDRINKSGLINATLSVEGDHYTLGSERELVLFRIFQEGLNNTLKYANAEHLKIGLQYHLNLFTLTIEDNGRGFIPETLDAENGLGLKNIKSRATLIGAMAVIHSSPGNGCQIKISLDPFEPGLYTDGSHTDRLS